jgi:hypothetical protein
MRSLLCGEIPGGGRQALFVIWALRKYTDKVAAARKAIEPMSKTLIELELPRDLARFRLPSALNARLHELLDQQDNGIPLSATQRQEAEGLVDLAEMLSLLRLRAERARKGKAKRK